MIRVQWVEHILLKEFSVTGQKVYAVPSIVRAMNVLELLARCKRGASISEISRDLALPKSSTYLVVTTLEENGYLQRNVQTGKYYFGLKLVALGRKVLEHLDLREVARPFLGALMRRTGIIVHLAVLEGNEAVIIDRIEPPGQSAGADWIGRRLDINCTGVGKALVAYLSDEQFDQIITAKHFARHNDNTIVTIRGLKKELARVREQGYALDDEEDEIGLRCIGAPIFDACGRVVAAISLAATTEQIPTDRVRALAAVLRQAASEISTELKSLNQDDLVGSEHG
jgi:DNA-binding IclR family transcriptional regulator